MGLSFLRMVYNLDFTLKQKESGGRGHGGPHRPPSPTQEQPWEWVGRPQSGLETVRDQGQTCYRLAPAWHRGGTPGAAVPQGAPPLALGSPDGQPSTRVQEGKALQAPRSPDAASQHCFCRRAESRSLTLGVLSKVKSIFPVLGRLGLG